MKNRSVFAVVLSVAALAVFAQEANAQGTAACGCQPNAAYYAPAPTVGIAPTTTYYAPATGVAPTVTYYAPAPPVLVAPTTAYYAPTTTYYAPRPAYYRAPVAVYYPPAYRPSLFGWGWRRPVYRTWARPPVTIY